VSLRPLFESPENTRSIHIVSWRMKVGIADPEKISIDRQRHGKHISAVTNNHATEELLKAVFSKRSVPRLLTENKLAIFQGAHRSANCIRHSVCHMFVII
jgi:hypothetical protein